MKKLKYQNYFGLDKVHMESIKYDIDSERFYSYLFLIFGIWTTLKLLKTWVQSIKRFTDRCSKLPQNKYNTDIRKTNFKDNP